MEKHSFRFHDGKKGSALIVQIKIGAEQNRITRLTRDGKLIIELAGVMENEGINNDVVSFLSKSLKIRKDQIEIVAGSTKSEKLISIMDVNPLKLQEKISELL